MKSAGLLITGNEVLSAKTKDTNGPYIGMHLRKIGVAVRASMMCGDNEGDLLDCLHYLAQKSQFILMTGGLGPTSDDLTAQVVAKFFGIATEFNQAAWDACADFFVKAGRKEIPESNKKQAVLPIGCELLPNELGTAVGFVVSGVVQGKKIKVFSMPGVPYEMEKMFVNFVLPQLEDKSFYPITKCWQVFFMGESFMQNAINNAENSLLQNYPNSTVSYQAHPYYVSYSVTMFANSLDQKQACENYLNSEFTTEVNKAFKEHILYSEDLKVAPYIYKKLQELQLTLSFAEMSNGGYLGKEFSAFTNDSLAFKGGFSNLGEIFLQNALYLTKDLIQNKSTLPVEFITGLSNSVLTETKADICLAEFGFPKETNQLSDAEHSGYFFNICFAKSKLPDPYLVESKLASYGWKLLDISSNKETYNYNCFIKNNVRHSREIQQTRATLFLLCSLAKVLSTY